MKRRLPTLVAALSILILFPSCIVRSIHPWFRANQAAFHNDLLGGWIGVNEGSRLAMTFTRNGDNGYIVQYSNDDGHGIFDAHLARVGAHYYLDFTPAGKSGDNVESLLLLPTHSVAKLEFDRDNLKVFLLNYDALKAAARRHQLIYARTEQVEEDEVLVVSSSDELQAFLIANATNSDLFREAFRLKRR